MRALPSLVAALCLSLAFEDSGALAQLPPARNLLDGVIAALPDVPLRVTGELIARARPDAPELRRRVEMLLDWQAEPPTARYTLRDAFGSPLFHLAVTWRDPRSPEYRFFEGNPLRAAPVPPMTDPIPGTDLSWLDLSLSYLWWPNARTVGREDVRGQSCWVVDVPAPPDVSGTAGVRLWIGERIRALLRAETYNATNEAVRRFEVKSFKRINQRWMIKDIDVVSLPVKSRSTLRIQTVEDRERRSFLREGVSDPHAGNASQIEELSEFRGQDPDLDQDELSEPDEISPIEPVEDAPSPTAMPVQE
ncbi:MAG: outer membrane lipoprotein-sorting protein [Kiritimatiellae bacterium]|nr:outer membrane lipoprotein-sorting protein [Kiritimatiellia bacterium]MDW8459505.1 outer membrane lipoprotein-sorting protein [Verrucomicrobiota bacterium]